MKNITWATITCLLIGMVNLFIMFFSKGDLRIFNLIVFIFCIPCIFYCYRVDQSIAKMKIESKKFGDELDEELRKFKESIIQARVDWEKNE